MKIKKILSLILLFFISASIFVPTASAAIQNTNYSFVEGGLPSFIDHPYDLSYSYEGKSLNLKGTLYPKYNNALVNYIPYYISLKNESSYHGLAGLTTLVFVETKKLQQGTNRLVSAKYYSNIPEENVSGDKSPFGIEIDCTEDGACEVFAYAGLNYIFGSDTSNFDSSLKNQTFTQRQRVKVENYKINKNTDQDFMLLLNFEYSQTRNPDTNYEDGRIRIRIETETSPGSGVMKKVTDATHLSNTFISYLYKTTGVGHPAIELSFLDYRNVFSLDQNKIKSDLGQLYQKIYFQNWDQSFYESYYKSIKGLMHEYLLELGFKIQDLAKSDLENVGVDTNANPFDPEKMRKGETDFAFKDCGTLDILCHIQNAVGYLSYKSMQIFSAIFSPLIGVIKNIWNGFADIIKGIFTWLWETIFNSKPVQILWNGTKGIWDFFYAFFEPILKVVKGELSPYDLIYQDQQYLCSKDHGFFVDNTTPTAKKPAEALGLLIAFVNPIPPNNGTYICTNLGLKQIEYGKETILSTILFNIFVFAGVWFMFLFLRKYN